MFCTKNVKNEGFLKKKVKILMNIDDIENPSLWIENWCHGGHFKPLSIFDQIWTTFRKMDFFDFFRFSNILCYFPLLFWEPKMSKYDFFQLIVESPLGVQKMCCKLLGGSFTSPLSISKLRIIISHDLTKISQMSAIRIGAGVLEWFRKKRKEEIARRWW